MERQLRAAGLLSARMFALPSEEASLDAYGNMRRPEVVRILVADLCFRVAAMQRQSEQQRPQQEAALPGNACGLSPGIYQRDGTDARPVVTFVRAPSTARLRFHDIEERAGRANIGRRLEEAVRPVNARFAARR
ncbi:hypothetical protein VY88_03115 [Azospirillum thiophilum]|uniref:Uncharacterized protein n=1 Tax=Azospirillum thiophilum TaxID=528244 RepID=A0AAC9EXF5_9PROT|nr:hypothetical protein [Azospirillum thiophilum]ALG71126.1 hypothetical protein AL072_09590 [Azospirillum thiophilum]KJR65216.1 hypothetical protein VY88_03115 [Azospirillum thiophilum]